MRRALLLGLLASLAACQMDPVNPTKVSIPATPANFTAAALTSSSVKLDWAKVSGATSYTLERRTGSGSLQTIAAPTANTYTDTNLAANTTYSYSLKARNSKGSSPAVEKSASTPAPAASPPPAPASFSASAASQTTVNLTWAASAGATAYTLERRVGSGSFETLAVVSGSTAYADAAAQPATSYTYLLKARNGAGDSNPVTASATTPGGTTPPPPPPPPPGSLVAWAEPALQRVRPDDAAKTAQTLDLYAAKGEYESFQVVAKAPSGGLTNLSLSVSDLQGPGGAVIAKSNLTLYRQHYTEVKRRSNELYAANRSEGVGWYPDALIPFVNPSTGQPLGGGALRAVPASVAGGKNQPFWIDVSVPRGAAAGVYTGSYTVQADQGSVQGSFRLTVWNFTLPLKPSLQSMIPFTNVTYAENPAAKAELLRHRINPKYTDNRDQQPLIDNYGLSLTDLGYPSGAYIGSCSVTGSLPSADALRQHRQAYPNLVATNFTFDETDHCGTSLDETMKSWGRQLHAADVLQVATVTPRDPLLDDGSGTGRPAIDIFVMSADMYKRLPADVEGRARAKSAFWSYTALLRYGVNNSFVWMLDYGPMNFRAKPGFFSQSAGFKGVLYWAADHYADLQGRPFDRWTDPETLHQNIPHNGEGYLTYPGEKVGLPGTVVPSMRMKWIRDGVEDFEYVELLRQRGRGDWAVGVVRTVVRGFEDWDNDPAKLEAARRQLGEALSQ